MEKLNNAVQLSHHFINEIVEINDNVIDATVGNGRDFLYLAEKTDAHLYGFDIQESAILNTRKNLETSGTDMERVHLFQADHAELSAYIEGPVGLVLFNLGYLPGGDKTITTKAVSTIRAMEQSLTFLRPGGGLISVLYPGHPAGIEEKTAVLEYVKELDQRKFNVVSFGFPNQRGTPPELVIIEKRVRQIDISGSSGN